MFSHLILGFSTLFTPSIFLYLLGGLIMGLFFGAVPGLTATLAIALLLPFTFSMETASALVMVMGIYAGGIYGGCLTAITIRIPGAPASAMTMLDGYPLMERGEGDKAISHATFASSVGGIIGAIILIFLAPQVAQVALLFRSPERFSLIVLALLVVATATRGSLLKGILSTGIGLMMATSGIDMMVPRSRFTFGLPLLQGGISLLPAVIGLFAISELLRQMELKVSEIKPIKKFKMRYFFPPLEEIRAVGWLLYIKSALIGTGTGALPGGGAAMASFLAYGEAKRSSSHPEQFGKGAIEGIAAPEAANNAMTGGAIIPLLTLGIPGDAVTALIFGVLLIQGLVPGPRLLVERADIIAPMFAALLIAKLLLLPMGFLFAPLYLRIPNFKRGLIFSFIATICIVGAYVAEFSVYQMWLALIIGILAYFLQRADYPIVPILMGIILGPYLERYFRRSMTLSMGNPLVFITSPISLGLLILAVVFIIFLNRQKKVMSMDN